MKLPKDVEGVRVLAEKLAREHVDSGGKVVGYLTPCVPAEMIEAAGMRAMMLSAGTETSTALGDHYMEDLFDTALRGVFERLLKGEFDYLSAIVLPRANDSAHRLYYYLSEIERTGRAKLPPVLLCDVVMTPDQASRRHSVNALRRLWGDLRNLGNAKAGDGELRAAMAVASPRWNPSPTVDAPMLALLSDRKHWRFLSLLACCPPTYSMRCYRPCPNVSQIRTPTA
jgi:hypothetical protein